MIAVAHPKWLERPLLVAIKAVGAEIEKPELLAYLSERVAKWQLPDDVVFVDELPHTATGKLKKTELRRRFGGYKLPDADSG